MGNDAPKDSGGVFDPGNPAAVSEKVSGPIGEYFRTSLDGPGGVNAGTMLAYLAGAIGAWWLSGKSVLLTAAGGIVAAWAFPRIVSALGQTRHAHWAGNGHALAPDSAKSRSRAGHEATRDDSMGGTRPTAEVNEARLGNLSLSDLLPKPKGNGDRRRS